MRMHDLMDMRLLDQMMEQGYVKAQRHPKLPFVIYNYTNKTQYENVWNDVTEQCRGLIAHLGTCDIIARPFRKFFNFGQERVPYIKGPIHVTDKADGSLGVLYPSPGLTRSGFSIATRGSFTSEQAVHATKLFNDRYATRWGPVPDFTFLFEIVYPENRIVLNYGGTDDLFMLTAVDNLSGRSIPHAASWSRWPGPTVQTFEYNTFREALEAPPRPNAEGLVIYDIPTGARVKIKQADYVAMHKILTGITARMVWRYLAVNACKHLVGTRIKQPKHWGSVIGVDPKEAEHILAVGDGWVDKFIAGMPDELFAWLDATIGDLNERVDKLRRTVEIDMHTCAAQTSQSGPFNRGEFFRLAREMSPEHWGMIGSLYDGYDITPQLWKAVYPGVETPFKFISEDVA